MWCCGLYDFNMRSFWGLIDRPASAAGFPDLSRFWCFLQRGAICVVCGVVFEVMHCAFILCVLHRVFRLPLGSFVTFAIMIIYRSITAECLIMEGLH